MNEQQRFEKFTKELAKLSKKYGVAIKAIGGIAIGEIAEIEYSNDETSGDLYPEILMWQEDVEG
ncbi:MAG: hypothetical protein WCK67_11130 [bacterium]